jgi:hypothetical protein
MFFVFTKKLRINPPRCDPGALARGLESFLDPRVGRHVERVVRIERRIRLAQLLDDLAAIVAPDAPALRCRAAISGGSSRARRFTT